MRGGERWDGREGDGRGGSGVVLLPEMGETDFNSLFSGLFALIVNLCACTCGRLLLLLLVVDCCALGCLQAAGDGRRTCVHMEVFELLGD